jgi:hypothetical protein
VTGEDSTEWMRDYLTAIYVDDSGVANLDVASLPYRITTWSYRSIYAALNGSYQLTVGSLGNGSPLVSTMGQGGSTAFAGFTVAPGTTATITFTQPAGSYEFWYRVFRRQ